MKILLADDDPTLRMLMRELLEARLSCEVVEASNGEEAWKLLATGDPVDVCILDIRMPRMGGLELIARMRGDERFKQQKVMICSGVNERAPVLEAVSMGVDSYLLKPFNGDVFQERVMKLFGKLSSTPFIEPLVPMKEVLSRLGTAPETYIKLLGSFTNDVKDVIETVRGPWGNSETRSEYAYRLAAIQNSGQTLGAGLLASRAAALEQAVAKNDVAAKIPRIGALEVENRRVIAATARINNELITERSIPEVIVSPDEFSSQDAQPAQRVEGVDVTLDFLINDRDKNK